MYRLFDCVHWKWLGILYCHSIDFVIRMAKFWIGSGICDVSLTYLVRILRFCYIYNHFLISDCNWTWTQNHLVHKHTLNHLASLKWPNGQFGQKLFVYELSGSGFKSSYSHLNFRFCACLKQRVPWHSGNYRVWIHSETRKWHDKNIHFLMLKISSWYMFFSLK